MRKDELIWFEFAEPAAQPLIKRNEISFIEGWWGNEPGCSPCLVFGWVMGAAAPMAPPKKRQTARERAARSEWAPMEELLIPFSFMKSMIIDGMKKRNGMGGVNKFNQLHQFQSIPQQTKLFWFGWRELWIDGWWIWLMEQQRASGHQ